MPTSDHYNINPLLTILLGLQPHRILDIGCGFGKYGMLLREYLDVWNHRLAPASWQLELVGVEAFPGYHNPIHDFIYNKVHFGEGQEIVPKLGNFDVVLIADVIEHLHKPAAQSLVKQCLEQSSAVVISTPKEFYPQESQFGNDYEIHHHLWTEEDYPAGVNVRKVPVVSCNIFVASKKPLPSEIFTLSDPADLIYLRSRMKLGTLGLPLSYGLKLLCRWLA